jgi:hypothetical protein
MIPIILFSLLVVGISWYITKNYSLKDKVVYYAGLLVKVVCGLLVGWLYWSYYDYSGDTIYYFEQAGLVWHYLREGYVSISELLGLEALSDEGLQYIGSASQPRTWFFVRLITPLYGVSGGNYFVLASYLSFVSFLGIWLLVRQLNIALPTYKWPVFISFLFWPSFVFWSSGLLKESMFVAAFGIYNLILLNLYRQGFTIRRGVLLFIAIWLVWHLKYYVAIVWFPISLSGMLVLLNADFIKSRLRQIPVMFFWIVFLLIGGVSIAFMHPVFNSGRFFELLRISHDMIPLADLDIHFNTKVEGARFLLINAPKSIGSGLFRPFIWEAETTLSVLYSIENLFLLLLTIVGLVTFFKQTFSQKSKMLIIGILLFSVAIALITSLSTPNFGSIARYKVAFLPYYVMTFGIPIWNVFASKRSDNL